MIFHGSKYSVRSEHHKQYDEIYEKFSLMARVFSTAFHASYYYSNSLVKVVNSSAELKSKDHIHTPYDVSVVADIFGKR